MRRAILQSIARRRGLNACVQIIAVAILASAPTAFGQLGGEGEYDSHGVLWAPWNPDDWTRRFRVGAVVGLNVNANFNMSGRFNVSGVNPDAGVYSDGYVRTDNTGDQDGLTSYWGYENSSQYNSSANTLAMHSADSFTTSDSASKEAGAIPGLDLAYSVYFWRGKHFSIGGELGFDLLPIDISDNNPLSGDINLTTYLFDTTGTIPPEAGETGYHGGPSGTGPLITDHSYSSSTDTIAGGIIQGHRSLDVTLYLIRLGPTFNLDFGRNFSLTAGIGPAVGIVDGEYKFDEHVIVNDISTRNKGHFDSTKLVYGGYVNVTFLYHLPRVEEGNVDIFLSTQYTPLSSATFQGENREARLNLGSQLSVSLGFNWPF